MCPLAARRAGLLMLARAASASVPELRLQVPATDWRDPIPCCVLTDPLLEGNPVNGDQSRMGSTRANATAPTAATPRAAPAAGPHPQPGRSRSVDHATAVNQWLPCAPPAPRK